MNCSLLEDLIAANEPCRVETAAGRVFEIPHRNFVNLTPKKTALAIFSGENGEDHFAIVPLLTVTSAVAKV